MRSWPVIAAAVVPVIASFGVLSSAVPLAMAAKTNAPKAAPTRDGRDSGKRLVASVEPPVPAGWAHTCH